VAAPSFGVQATAILVRATAEIEPALQSFARQANGGLMLTADNFTLLRHALIIEQADRLGLPSAALGIDFARRGGLIEYSSPDYTDTYRRAASYVDRILKGEKPADLPVQNPTKFKLTVNLKTANALGLAIPESLLATASEVIE
jgi:putative tryptophan/tyrosine transport system substrate-binding protein